MGSMEELEADIVRCAYRPDEDSEPWVNVPVSIVSEWVGRAVSATVEQVREAMNTIVEENPARKSRHV